MKIAICDSDKEHVEKLRRIINNLVDTQGVPLYVDCFYTSKELLHKFYDKQYDLVYLAIEIRDENGINVAEIIHNIKPNTIIIFVSSYIKYMNSTFKVNAFQFIQKPINNVFFIQELYRAINHYRRTRKTYIIPTHTGEHIFNIDHIIYFQTTYDKFKIHTFTVPYYGTMKMLKNIKEDIQEYSFYKIQRSYIINLRHVITYDKTSVTMINGDILSISPSKYEDFQKQLLRFLDI